MSDASEAVPLQNYGVFKGFLTTEDAFGVDWHEAEVWIVRRVTRAGSAG